MEITLNGKYNDCTVFTDQIDDSCISQIMSLLNQDSIKDSHIAIMPDAHAGKGCVIGTTMTLHDKVIPNLVGVDIGCGMLTVQIDAKTIDFEQLDRIIRNYIPFGPDVHEKAPSKKVTVLLDQIRCIKEKDHAYQRAVLSLGTLGGGNHFIEIDKDRNGNFYLVIHSGSRHLGKYVATHYQEAAYQQLEQELKRKQREILEQTKPQDRQALLKAFKQQKVYVPKELAYCQGYLMQDYLHDMDLCQKFASQNRNRMAEIIMKEMNWKPQMVVETIHNYIDMKNMILRKGAVSAQKDEILLIPMNMKDGSLLCKGKGNSRWNYSAPHGAGRLLSRSQARETVSLEDYQAVMKEAGIFSTCVTKSTIDESPFAYKSMDSILENIHDSVEVLERLVPVYNFKATN